jgi:hypothetical protein
MLNRREFVASAAAAAAAARRPNILHIMSAQQQWGTIAGRSECRAPNLNRLAEAGMLFERSYTPSAVCCPARAMMLSGAYHGHNGVYNQIHSSPSVHRDLNPDRVERPKAQLKRSVTRQMQWRGSEPFAMWGYREGPEEATPEYYLAECAIRMMRRFARSAEPWHLEVQFVEPHDPYFPLKPYLDRYDPRAIKVPKSFSDTFRGKPGA